MKIVISAESADLEAEVARRFGTSKYLVIVDLGSGDSEAVPNPGASAQRGAGMQAVVLAISKDVKAVLTGYCSPAINNHLTENGIEVVSGLSDTVGEVVERYKKGDFRKYKEVELEYRPKNGVRLISLSSATQSGLLPGSLLPCYPSW
jgi:predicted Fe-Mo cluster-binding NifX family protein